ncbi:hypothetical protein ACIQVO_35980 [Streptomyces sp. NPDC101062]|uniref:hypothetical protein n=1 Tax=unclassified Streptomyces TaxID=2593676 RepID=UPI0037FE4CFE
MVDEVLAAALTAQGEAGVRALGLLRDAARGLLNAVDAFPAAGGDGGVPEEVPDARLERVRQAAQVLRGQLARPGGYHRGGRAVSRSG